MADGMAEAVLKARIKQYREEIAAIESKAQVTLVDRLKITRMSMHLGGLREALGIITTYAEPTRGRSHR